MRLKDISAALVDGPLFSEEAGCANSSANRRLSNLAEACRLDAERIVKPFVDFLAAVSPVIPKTNQRRRTADPLKVKVLLGEHTVKRRGKGMAVAVLTARTRHYMPVAFEDIYATARVDIAFSFLRRGRPEVEFSPTETYDAGGVADTLALAAGCAQDEYAAGVRQAQEMVYDMAFMADDTLELLDTCGRDPDLNPELAVRLEERMPRLAT